MTELDGSNIILDSSNKHVILMFSANYLPNIGGIEKFTFYLSRELEKMGNHVVIVTNNVFDLPLHETFNTGVEIYRFPCFPIMNGRLPVPKKNKDFHKLLAQINRIDSDYVFINTRFYPHTFIGARLALKHNIVPVILDHGSAYLTLGNPIADFAIKIYEKVVTAVQQKYHAQYYGISQASLNWLNNFNISGSGIINNSIDAEAYLEQASSRDYREELGLSPEDFLVSFTGRLIPEKGISHILDSAKILLNINSNIHFALAGDGPLKKVINSEHLPNIHLLGKLSTEDIASLLKQSDAFCLPTRSEGFSTSLLEAAACYTTPVITNVGGVEELIPSQDYGIVLEKADGHEIAHALLYLCANSAINKKLAQNIGNRVRALFSWRNTATKVLAACKTANANHSHFNF